MSSRTLYLERGSTAVALHGPEEILRSVSAALETYLTIREVHEIAPRAWTVQLEPGSPPGPESARTISIQATGEPACTYLFDPDSRSIRVVEPLTEAWLSQHGARLVRVLTRLQLLEQRALFVHGGMVESGSVGVAFIGGKRAGKTTSIISFLALDDTGSYVTNDDLTLVRAGDSWTGLGWPRAISVQHDSIGCLRDELGVAPLPDTLSHPANESMAHRRARGATGLDASILYPFELARWLGRPRKASATLHAIVFPSFLPRSRNEAHLEQLAPARAEQLLLENLERDPNKYERFLLPSFDLPRPGELEQIVHELADQVPCYALAQSMSALGQGTRLIRNLVHQATPASPVQERPSSVPERFRPAGRPARGEE